MPYWYFISLYFVVYYVRHKAQMHENRRFFRAGISFAKNLYVYMFKAPSRN